MGMVEVSSDDERDGRPSKEGDNENGGIHGLTPNPSGEFATNKATALTKNTGADAPAAIIVAPATS